MNHQLCRTKNFLLLVFEISVREERILCEKPLTELRHEEKHKNVGIKSCASSEFHDLAAWSGCGIQETAAVIKDFSWWVVRAWFRGLCGRHLVQKFLSRRPVTSSFSGWRTRVWKNPEDQSKLKRDSELRDPNLYFPKSYTLNPKP